MDQSSDSGHERATRPAPRSKRRRSGSDAVKETALNSQETGVMRGNHNNDTRGSRFIGSGSGIHFIRTVYSMLAGNSVLAPTTEGTTSPDDAVPGEDDELSSDRLALPNGSATGTSPDADLWTSDEVVFGQRNVRPPTFEDLIAWTRPYFENWHPIFPFLHAPSVLKMFDVVSKSGLHSVTAADRVIIRALISIGVADARQAQRQPAPPPAYFVFRNVSQLMTDSQFAICLPATLENLQALFAAQLFLVSMLKFNFASRLGGAVVRMAFHLGLHRCPSRYRNFKASENQLRRRMFFCIYCLDRVLCQSLGLPLGIHDTDIDVCYPGEEVHGLAERTAAAVELQDDGKQLQTMTLFAKHARIRGMILELRNKAIHFRHETAKRATKIELELSKWSNQLHEIIDELDETSPPNNATCPISTLHRIYLLLLEHESIITLNRPLITANKSNTNAMSALQNCIKASRSVITILDDYRLSNSGSYGHDGRLVVPMTWPLVTWCCWMSCFILAFAALEGRSKIQFATRFADKSLKILEHLSLRMTRWPDLCGDAVKHVKTALVMKASNANDAEPPQTDRPASSLRSHLQALPVTANTGDGISALAAQRKKLTLAPIDSSIARRSQSAILWSATSVRQPSSEKPADLLDSRSTASLMQHAYDVDSPDTIAAQSGRFADIGTYGFTDFSANAYDQGLFDPFSAIDMPNFTVFNYNFAGEFGTAQEDLGAAANPQT